MIDYPKIQRAARSFARRLPAGSIVDADDLAQEYAIAALKGRTPGSGQMWDHLRYIDPLSRMHRRAINRGLEIAPKSLSMDAISPDGKQMQIASRDRGEPQWSASADVHALLAHITPKQREAVALHHLVGMTETEMVRLLGTNVQTLRNRIHIGLKNMRRLIQ